MRWDCAHCGQFCEQQCTGAVLEWTEDELKRVREKVFIASKAIRKMKRETKVYGKAQSDTMNKALKDLK